MTFDLRMFSSLSVGNSSLEYKPFYNGKNIDSSLDLDKFITKDDCDVESYVFPDELFCIKDKVKGYKSQLVQEDL